ncbi:E3 ubiquitin-protein ligase MBR2-like [Malania oleifera]|uniref:E3 ubiquitin-protein ligase MBR2-like n=1 Tax=Malania oleifera TaxID=397392 RepID=UPI0025AEC1C7|nr:E3 ubiquitin-protein ligase MBR2-like [Malania oleifera]XP_057963644.1 E3 ubiquitin-protein ligase MBR2-like [Malania oleifera]XP_057963645.1 E3 ubiquitin-protein ligase MBR2-like [Malania oleifera]XP_057963646.1 E3 ubiquitin-protein ligase MBR2-like [Malania oleifera]XP_057963647.1 E3 ubiquitin-protein ligase MBR2-like [Malania oleifera]XP_057963648.1 E3 ubiquitin-protein ligase MBR2-like [Malania oleifera]XP_057963649.1 E3 ubiquitin-protein ligase MBR2-like [Malania oleifera]
MQGQKSTVDSFSGIEQGSISNNTGMNQQNSWNHNMLNPVENQLSNYMRSSNETNFTCGNAVNHDVRNFSGWNLGEPSSSVNPQNQVTDDSIKMEHSWSPSFSVHAGSAPREERLFEPAGILSRGSANVGLRSSQVTSGHLFLPSSSSNNIPQNVNLNAGYVGSGGNGGQGMRGGVHCNLYKSGGSETEQMSSGISFADNVGSSSGSSGKFVEENDCGSSSSASWGSSCKRKALEGTSGQSYPGGSSSCFPQAESSVWHAVPPRYNASGSLNISAAPVNTPTGSPPEHLNPRIGVGIRALTSDAFPSLGATGNAESSFRNFNGRATTGHPQDSVPFSLSSTGSRCPNVSLPHQSSRPLPVSDSLDIRSTTGVATSTIAAQSQTHIMHIPGFSRDVLPFPWNGPLNSRAGSSSHSLVLPAERGTALREEANLRSIPRNNTEHPMFAPTTETRNVAQDPTNWSLATGNMGTPGGVPSTSRIGPSSNVHTLPTPSWIPNHNPPAQNQPRLSEFSPWSLFSPVDSESGGQSGAFPSMSSGPSASSQEAMMTSGSNNQGRLFPRSAFLMERQGDDVLGSPHSLRALAADIEGRHRLISEIRQVLSAMRRGEHLRAEDYMLFDPFIYHGMSDLHDRHRDMRLDVDNMTYEELLALEERIGDVKTGLSEETILKLMKQRKLIIGSPRELEPCCICQEEYAAGDDLGTLVCGHDFHTNCIKQWLMLKNLCPICKTTALIT